MEYHIECYILKYRKPFFAGRNISATHAAMSSTRVMATCYLLGQAMGTAAGICVNEEILPREINNGYIKQLQQKLLENGVFLPDIKREISNVTKNAKLNICDKQKAILFNGIDRPRNEEEMNRIELEVGSSLEFEFEKAERIDTLRIQFDLDYERESVSPNMKMQWFAQKLNRGLDFVPMKVANTIVRAFEVYADGVKIYGNENNYYSLVKISINRSAKKIVVRFNKTWGAEKVNLFACDFI